MKRQVRDISIATAVVIISPQGMVFVKSQNRKYRENGKIYYKLPGGRVKVGETTPIAAIRELREETGIHVSKNDLKVLYRQQRKKHRFVLYGVYVDDLKTSGCQKRGPVTGEHVLIEKGKGIDWMFARGDILPVQVELLRNKLVRDNMHNAFSQFFETASSQ